MQPFLNPVVFIYLFNDDIFNDAVSVANILSRPMTGLLMSLWGGEWRCSAIHS
jgi:hypothetical protein